MLTLLNYTINKLIENYCWLLIKNNFKKKQLAEGKKIGESIEVEN